MNIQRNIAVVAGILIIISFVFYLGYGLGVKISDIAFQDYVSRGKQLALENSLKFREMEKAHSIKEQELLAQLAEERKIYEASVSSITDDYNSRLLQQKNRADSYKRQLEVGECVRPEFIAYATKLDRSLEEGIYLVEELSQTVRFLEYQLENRLQLINNDRKTVNERE